MEGFKYILSVLEAKSEIIEARMHNNSMRIVSLCCYKYLYDTKSFDSLIEAIRIKQDADAKLVMRYINQRRAIYQMMGAMQTEESTPTV